MVFLLVGILLYSTIPTIGQLGSIPLFVAASCIILSMYGGGFAAVPAYLRDLFGTYQVGAIHGQLLTASSVAPIVGPVLVNCLRRNQIHPGSSRRQQWSFSL